MCAHLCQCEFTMQWLARNGREAKYRGELTGIEEEDETHEEQT